MIGRIPGSVVGLTWLAVLVAVILGSRLIRPTRPPTLEAQTMIWLEDGSATRVTPAGMDSLQALLFVALRDSRLGPSTSGRYPRELSSNRDSVWRAWNVPERLTQQQQDSLAASTRQLAQVALPALERAIGGAADEAARQVTMILVPLLGLSVLTVVWWLARRRHLSARAVA